MKLDFKEHENVLGIFTEFLSELGLYVTDVKGCTRNIQREWLEFIDSKFKGRVDAELENVVNYIANKQEIPIRPIIELDVVPLTLENAHNFFFKEPFNKDNQHRDLLEPDTICRDIEE